MQSCFFIFSMNLSNLTNKMENTTHTYLWLLLVKFTFRMACLFVFVIFPFITSNWQLPIYSTHITNIVRRIQQKFWKVKTRMIRNQRFPKLAKLVNFNCSPVNVCVLCLSGHEWLLDRLAIISMTIYFNSKTPLLFMTVLLCDPALKDM